MTKSKNKDALVSIIGSGFFEPLSVLISQLFNRPTSRPNPVQAHPFDNGYAVSICILAVTCLESFLTRAKYVRKCSEKKVLEFFSKCFPEYPDQAKFKEVFVLRDSLVHNHLWEIGFDWIDEGGNMELREASKDKASGDKKYDESVDFSLRKTKILGLNVIPIKIDRGDVKIILKEVWNILMFLEKTDRSLCYVSHLHVKHNDRTMAFGDVICQL